MSSFLSILLMVCWLTATAQEHLYISEQGSAKFTSEASLELIKAESKALRGVINPVAKSFAFTVSMESFHGFNSDIQRTHFLENYMEQKQFPSATFVGKIIEDIPFDVPGTYTVRAKGELEIHGIKKERIIKGTLTISGDSAHVTSDFTVPLSDHGIAIPKIVSQKIAEQILVSIDIAFMKGNRI